MTKPLRNQGLRLFNGLPSFSPFSDPRCLEMPLVAWGPSNQGATKAHVIGPGRPERCYRTGAFFHREDAGQFLDGPGEVKQPAV